MPHGKPARRRGGQLILVTASGASRPGVLSGVSSEGRLFFDTTFGDIWCLLVSISPAPPSGWLERVRCPSRAGLPGWWSDRTEGLRPRGTSDPTASPCRAAPIGALRSREAPRRAPAPREAERGPEGPGQASGHESQRQARSRLRTQHQGPGAGRGAQQRAAARSQEEGQDEQQAIWRRFGEV